jgi:hypothetical protein
VDGLKRVFNGDPGMNNTKRELTALSVDETRFPSREFDCANFTVTPERLGITAAPCASTFRKAAPRAKEVF